MNQDHSLQTSPISEQKVSTSDEITYAGIKDMFAQLFRLLVKLLDFLKAVLFRYILFLLFGIFVALIIGYFYYDNSKRDIYKVAMVVEFTELNKLTYAEIFSQLNTLILSGSHQELAKELKVPLPVAENIGFIETFNIKNEPLHKDTSQRLNQTFKVVVSLKNDQISDTLEQSIVNYLNNNPFLVRLKNSQRKIEEYKLLFIDNELKKLDSLKSQYNRFFSSTKSNPTLYNNAINPAEIYFHSEILMKEREKTVKWLDTNTLPINVITGFKVPVKLASASLKPLLFIFGIGGFILAFIIALFVELKRTLIG